MPQSVSLNSGEAFCFSSLNGLVDFHVILTGVGNTGKVKMAARPLASALISSLILTVWAQNFDFDNIPGVAYEFRVHVDSGKEDCFYQFVQSNATVYVSFQVIRGGDGMAGFAVRHPNGVHVHPYQWKAESEYTEVSQSAGFYEICVDNQFSRFASKLVNVYITTFRHDEWDAYVKELEDLELSVTNFTSTISMVETRVNSMLQHQQYSRRHEARDISLLSANNQYVQYWSLAQCCVILLTTCLQVYFLRKFFETKDVTPTSKPRA